MIHLVEPALRPLCGAAFTDADVFVVDVLQWRHERAAALQHLVREGFTPADLCPVCIKEDRRRQLPHGLS